MNHVIQAITVVIPIIFVLFFGFFAERQKMFGENESTAIANINEMVLTFALPPALFVGTITVTRSELAADFVLFAVLFVSLLIAYLVGFAIAKLCFKRSIIEGSIAGLAVSFSAGPFYGPALLGSIYPEGSAIAVSMISLVINVFIVPLATIMIKLHIARESKQHTSTASLIGHSIFDAIFKTPFVWAPLLAFILVFLNLHTPLVVNNSLELIGKATAGLAVFVAGMTVASNKFKVTFEVLVFVFLKNIALPILFVFIAVLFSMTKGSALFNEGLLLAALPSGPMIVLLATRYKAYQQQGSSILAVSTVGMIITVTAIIAICGI